MDINPEKIPEYEYINPAYIFTAEQKRPVKNKEGKDIVALKVLDSPSVVDFRGGDVTLSLEPKDNTWHSSTKPAIGSRICFTAVSNNRGKWRANKAFAEEDWYSKYPIDANPKMEKYFHPARIIYRHWYSTNHVDYIVLEIIAGIHRGKKVKVTKKVWKNDPCITWSPSENKLIFVSLLDRINEKVIINKKVITGNFSGIVDFKAGWSGYEVDKNKEIRRILGQLDVGEAKAKLERRKVLLLSMALVIASIFLGVFGGKCQERSKIAQEMTLYTAHDAIVKQERNLIKVNKEIERTSREIEDLKNSPQFEGTIEEIASLSTKLIWLERERSLLLQAGLGGVNSCFKSLIEYYKSLELNPYAHQGRDFWPVITLVPLTPEATVPQKALTE